MVRDRMGSGWLVVVEVVRGRQIWSMFWRHSRDDFTDRYKCEGKSKRGIKQGRNVEGRAHMGRSVNQKFSFDMLSGMFLIGI